MDAETNPTGGKLNAKTPLKTAIPMFGHLWNNAPMGSNKIDSRPREPRMANQGPAFEGARPTLAGALPMIGVPPMALGFPLDPSYYSVIIEPINPMGYVEGVLAFLRFIGLVNAAIWFGTALFFTFAVGPVFFSDAILNIFGGRATPYSKAYAGLVAIVVMKRYFIWLQVCGVIAVCQGLAETTYQGQTWRQFRNLLAMGLLAASLVGGFWLEPTLARLQAVKYDSRATPTQKELATRSFGMWHGISQGVNLLMVAGLLVFLWKTAHPHQRDPLAPNPFQYRI
jgi:hypothetical protein